MARLVYTLEAIAVQENVVVSFPIDARYCHVAALDVVARQTSARMWWRLLSVEHRRP